MGSLFGRAVLVAGAIVTIVGPATGAAAGPRPSALVFTPSPYGYGQVAAGQTASRTFTLSNQGGSATGRLRVTLAGAAAFTITGDTCKSLPPGKRCAVTVRFAPAGAGAVTATLTAASKKQATVTDALTGTGGVGGPAPGHLYWAAGGTIWEANLDGSNPRAIVTGQPDPAGVAVNASHLYWTDSGSGAIWAANLDGSNPQAIVTGQISPAGVAVNASHLYWTDSGAIWEANLDGSNPQVIVTGQNDAGFGVAVDASHLYWTDTDGGTIWEANLDGTNPQAVVSGQQLPYGIAVGGGGPKLAGPMYWTNRGDGTVNVAALDGTNPLAIVSGQHHPQGMAVSSADGGDLYWANNGDGTIWEADWPDGANPHAIVTGQQRPVGVAVGPQ
jgi:Domain of unknown function (DUF5050)